MKSIFDQIEKGNWLVSLVLSVVLVTICSCQKGGETKVTEWAVKSVQKEIYEPPQVPMVLETVEEKADFVAQHFWDNFPMDNAAKLKDTAYIEQTFVDFINVMKQLSPELSLKAFQVMMSKAGVRQEALLAFQALGEKYLYDPNSPYCNDGWFVEVLKPFIASPLIEDAQKIRSRKLLELAEKNNVGMVAVDFLCAKKNGSTLRMHQIKAPYLLLYFHNPDCHDCKTVREQLVSSILITRLVERGTIKILTVYPDEDKSIWLEHYAELPESWLNTCDPTARIKEKDLYDLKAIPTLYLLDSQKKVLLKDVRFNDLELYLANLSRK